jgi:ABC-type Na+ efflux pump permease subunit
MAKESYPMRNILLVIKHEIITTLQKRSFWITAFLFPLLIVGINLGTQLLINRPEGNSLAPAPSAENAGRTRVIGYVDQANLIKEIPADVPEGLLQQVVAQALAPKSAAKDSNPLTTLVPMAVLFIFFFLLVMSSGFMLQSVAREKENRTVEILLLSLRPRELMLGKILGLSVVALLQMAVWIGGGLLVLGRGKEVLSGAAAFELPAGFVIWALLYFLLGYLLYASLMGAIGALAPNVRESGQFTILVLLPLMIPVWFNSLFIQTPDSPLALALSLFPLTAPTSMITRLAATQVPTWQIAASLAGLAVTTYFLVQAAARFFRADTLLTNTTINWQRIFGAFQSGNAE